MSDLNQRQVEVIVEATVIKTLGELGINLTTPDARREFIEDQMYTRAWRRAVQRGAKLSSGTMIVVIVTGLLGALWVGIIGSFGGHP